MQRLKSQRLGGIFDLGSKKKTLQSLKNKTLENNFWNDSQQASSCLKKISIIEKEIQLWKNLKQSHDDVEVLFEFFEENEIEISEIIELALSDHASFDNIKSIYGIGEKDVKKLMRENLKSNSYKTWRKRVREFSDRRYNYK